MCYQNKIFYLVNVDDNTNPGVLATSNGKGNHIPLQTTGALGQDYLVYNSPVFLTPLPGSDQLGGTEWGNITLTDIVARSVETS